MKLVFIVKWVLRDGPISHHICWAEVQTGVYAHREPITLAVSVAMRHVISNMILLKSGEVP